MRRLVIIEPLHIRILKCIWKWICHPFRWCFSAQYREWHNFKWKPDIVIVKPMSHSGAKEVAVQPMSKPMAEFPVLRFKIPEKNE